MQNNISAKFLLSIFLNSKLVLGFIQISKNVPEQSERAVIVAFVYLSVAFLMKTINILINTPIEPLTIVLSD